MTEVLVLVDHLDGEVKKVTFELLTAARAIGEPSAVVVGAPGTAAKLKEALVIKEAHDGEVTVVSVGPERATESIRKALSMGADKAVHVVDDALHGSDILQTAKVLAAAIGTVEEIGRAHV